jgi:hypothetical protein
MEGYLKKWVNIMYRWKRRFFILHDDILVYCKEKGGEKKVYIIFLIIGNYSSKNIINNINST